MTIKTKIANKPSVYPWGVKVDFMINSKGGFSDLNGDNLSLLWHQDLILTLESRKIDPRFSDAGAKGYRLTASATDSASEAEAIGLKLAYSLLQFCIDKGWGVSLSWPDSPYPCRVIDRERGAGLSFQAFSQALCPVKISEFVGDLETSFSTHNDIPYSLLLSMELFASSHFENNQRSKLIMIVSALEALARQKDLSDELSEVISELTLVIKDTDIKDESLKRSLIGQVKNFKRESIRRALKRLLQEHTISQDDQRFVDEAYQIRSSIVHEGKRVPEISTINIKLERILREVYSRLKVK